MRHRKLRTGTAPEPIAGPVSGPDLPENEVDVVGVPLAKLIKRKLLNVPDIVMLNQSRSMAAEKFRRLKTILSNDPEDGPQIIVVTSAAPAEGKTLVSTNLALAFAADRVGSVLLLDGDLRRPSVDRWLEPPPKLGVADILRGKIDLEHGLLELENAPLEVLPAGTPPRDPVELLSSERTRDLLAELRRRYSRIIIDTPPIVPVTDADVLGAVSDGVLVVARSGSTPRSMLLQALSAVTSTRVLGTVLNDSTFSLADRETYYVDRQYHRYYQQPRRK
jgi:capsular exopolysaccharide synthesis family protein